MIPVLENSPKIRLLTLCLLYLAQGLPFAFVTGTLAGYLADEGYGLKEVAGLVFMAQVPWTFKFIWGPIVDRFGFPSLEMGRRRIWILIAEAMMILTLGMILLLPDLSTSITTLVWIVALHNVFASLQDVSVDAMAVELLPEKQRGKANGFMRASAFFGSFIGGAVMGVITASYGLDKAILLQLLIMIIIMLAPLFFREREGHRFFPRRGGVQARRAAAAYPKEKVSSVGVLFKDIKLAFSLRSTRIAAVLALVIFLSSSLLGSVGRVLILQDLGWSLGDYSKWFSGGGALLGLGGSVLGGFLADRFSAKRVAIIAGLLLGAVTVFFSFAEPLWSIRPFLVGVSYMETVLMGVMTVSIYAIFMSVSWPVIAGTHFTIYMAMLNLSLTAGTKLAGSLGSEPNYQMIYLLAGIAQIAFMGLIFMIDPTETRRRLGDGRSGA